ncbi:MAG TPA: hypothetical protein VG942_15150, partial [Hyphomonadaceae bacterium]|nr:hypothetical protein [Hyphomonadaceae bacterium]
LRVEFGDTVFDVYVETTSLYVGAPQIYQVRSEYRHPRAEMEKVLQPGRYISVAGWQGKISLDEFYQSPIALYATDFRLANGKELRPSGKTLIADASPTPPADPDKLPWLPPGYGVDTNVFDMDAPVVIDGKIVRTDADGYWVEVVGFDPASTPGARKGAIWHVVGELWEKDADIGKRITVTGYNARNKSCQPNCSMTGKSSYLR